MECSYETRSGAFVVNVQGKVDEASWEAFGDRLNDGIQQAIEGNMRTLVINLGALDYMSSRGLRALTIAKRNADAAGVAIALAAPNEVMREILAISRYDKLFKIADTVEAAS